MDHHLIGKFIFLQRGDYSQSGQITGMACDHVYLVQLDPDKSPPVCVLMTVSDMVESEGCFIFESRTEMDKWLQWLEREDDDVSNDTKVVSLVQH